MEFLAWIRSKFRRREPETVVRSIAPGAMTWTPPGATWKFPDHGIYPKPPRPLSPEEFAQYAAEVAKWRPAL